MVRRLWTNARLWTGLPSGGASPHSAGPVQEDRAILSDQNGKIAWLGASKDAPVELVDQTIDCQGALITPGLVDCHTHLVYAGDRAGEWRMRLEGASYEAIARAGGGILSTVTAVREADEARLAAESLPRLDALIADGVTTVEIKSGYGLDLDSEAKMLRVAGELAKLRPITIKRSYLGAHAIPPEAEDADAYIDQLIEVDLPRLKSEELMDAVDGFCESFAFSPDQIERLFTAAAELGLPVKLHAEQLSNLGGATLAARFKALSADHLEYLDEDGVKAIAASGTIAVLLPGAFYVLKESQIPPIDLLRKHNVPIAVATDCNPGSSPLSSLRLAMNMACTLFGLTPTEALLGATRNAARALGLQERKGVLTAGHDCDLAIWDVDTPERLIYELGSRPLKQRVWMGQ